MKYKSFTFKNFRGIKETTVKLSGGVICFLGLNAQGKTTILKGIDYFYKHLKEKMQGAGTFVDYEITNGTLYSCIPREENFTGQMVLSANIEDDNGECYEIIYSYEFKNSQALERCNRRITGISGDISQKLQEIANKVPDILFYEDFSFDLPNEILFVKYGSEQTKDNKNLFDAYKEPNNIFCQGVLNDVFKACYPELDGGIQTNIVDWLMNTPNGIETINMRVKRIEKELQNKIVSKWTNILASESQNINNDDKYTVNLSRSDDGKGFVSLKLKIWKNDKSFNLFENSLGMRWFFSFLLLTEFRNHRMENALFLLDEPATNMHCVTQGEILKSLVEVGNKANLIYTTHSPYLIEEALFFNTYIIKNHADNDIRATKYFDYKDKDKHVRLIDDHLAFTYPKEFTPDNFHKPRVLVEGKSDVFYFRLIEFLLNKALNFTIWRGFDKQNTARNMAMCQRDNVPFIVLHDNDSLKSTENPVDYYRKLFNGFYDNNIKILSDLVENATDIESLFDEQDIKKIVEIAEFEYREDNAKSLLCGACPKSFLKIKNGDTKLSLENKTINNFNILFDNISDILSKINF